MAQDSECELSKHETDVLLGLYSGCECLWNTKCADYKVRAIRLGALRTIVHGMRLEFGKSLTVGKVQNLLQSLQSVYERELQKVMKSEAGDASPYLSQWRWFFFLDSFARNHVLQKDSQPDDLSIQDLSGSRGDHDIDSDEPDTVADSDTEERLIPPPSSGRSQPSRSSRKRSAAKVTNGNFDSEDDEDWQPAPPSRTNSRKKSKPAPQQTPPKPQHTTVSRETRGRVQAFVREGRGGTRTQTTPTSDRDDNGRLTALMADSLQTVQVLLARTLSDNHQPSMVFARHLANELDQITDYAQRKQCMLDIQRVIQRYQTAPRSAVSIKAEAGGSVSGSGGGSNANTVAGSSSEVAEESLPLYFDLQSS